MQLLYRTRYRSRLLSNRILSALYSNKSMITSGILLFFRGGGVNSTIVVREWKSEWECVGYMECAW